MPDLRQQLRRVTGSRLLVRTTAHLLVIGLLVASSAFAFVSAQTADIPADDGFHDAAFALVGQARGADVDNGPEQTAVYSLQADPLHNDPMLSRKSAPTQPPTPAATPVKPPPASPEPPKAASAPQLGIATASRGGRLLWPLAGGVITQYYHAGHLALDIAAPYGTRVNAADGGVVVWAGWRNNGGGYVVQIDHGNGLQTAYNHLSAIWVRVGQQVARGQGIAAVGCTGDCTGPHCHFEVMVGGVFVNPLRYL